MYPLDRIVCPWLQNLPLGNNHSFVTTRPFPSPINNGRLRKRASAPNAMDRLNHIGPYNKPSLIYQEDYFIEAGKPVYNKT